MSNNAIEKLNNNIDDYNLTIHVICAFAHLFRWDRELNNFKPNSFYFIGRKMDTTNNNRISPNNIVTPDLIIQLSSDYGIVGEEKISFSRDRSYWNEDFLQIQKYDDDLIGWKTNNEQIDNIDVVLLIEYHRKIDVIEYLEEQIRQEKFSANKNFAVIVFSKTTQNHERITFEKAYGNISDSEMNNALHRVVSVRMEFLLMHYGGIKFVDVQPPLPLIMNILWHNVFSEKINIETLMEEKGKKQITLNVDLNELTSTLREQFTQYDNQDGRQPDIPKKSWVKEALDKFVELNYAEKVEGSPDEYIIKYKNIKNPLEKFCKECVKGRTEEPKPREIQSQIMDFLKEDI